MFLVEKELAPPLCAEGRLCGFGGWFWAGAGSPPGCGHVNVHLRIARPAAKRKFIGNCLNSGAGVVLGITVQL